MIVIIGCYDNVGSLNCGADPLADGKRAIIDGDNNSYPGPSQGAIEVRAQSFVTIQEIKVQYAGDVKDSESVSIRINDGSDHIDVNNSYMYRGNGSCIVYNITDTGIASDNLCEEAGYPNYTGTGAAITISANNVAGATKNITIARNLVKNGKFEGIGFYKKVQNCIAEFNTVRDMKSFHLYADSSQNITFRYNLVYETAEKVHSSFTESVYAIAIGNELARGYEYCGYNKVYGNLVAGMQRGLSLGCQIQSRIPSAVCHEDTLVYNNTFVDNDVNLTIWKPTAGDNIFIENNISYIKTSGGIHSNYYGTTGVKWSHNNFNTSVSGGAANNARIYDPGLKKTSGWRSLPPDAVDGSQFSLVDGSKNLGNGFPINNYNYRIASADFLPEVINVQLKETNPPDIGAWTSIGNSILPPQEFRILASK